MIKKLLLTVLYISISLQSLIAQGNELSFATIFQNNMVLQQEKPLKVWGTAIPGSTVRINADWLNSEVQVNAGRDGKFLGIIPMPSARPNDFSTHTLSIESNGERKEIRNLLIGEVWFLSGQSNMQFSMKEIIDSATEVPAANYPNIRFFNADLNFSATPINDIKGQWMVCTPHSILRFSAVGYFFGKGLFDELKIPVGLIFSGIGASSAQAYVPQETLGADTMLNRVYLQPYLQSERSKEKIDGGFTFEKVTRPFLLYNAMIHPFTNFSIKGFCWYQGESNRNERESYTHLTQELIKSWRQKFAQGDLPFYYVQVAPFFYDKEDPALADYAFFREAQENVSGLNNTAMVVTMDVGESKDLHPKNKKPIGIRLAKTALNRTYGHLTTFYQGPQYNYLEVAKNKAIIHFKPGTTGSGLRTKDGKEPMHFFVAGKDKVFHPAVATIKDNTIIVSSKNVKRPVAARYAFTNYPVTNLENKEQFPAVPFRTDDWKE